MAGLAHSQDAARSCNTGRWGHKLGLLHSTATAQLGVSWAVTVNNKRGAQVAGGLDLLLIVVRLRLLPGIGQGGLGHALTTLAPRHGLYDNLCMSSARTKVLC